VSQKLYRVGIIGCGWIAIKAPDNHLKAYQENSNTEMVALCDNDIWRIPYGGAEYTEYMDMVKKENLDIVSVCTPVETHYKIVTDIVPYVKAIYCEKPMATTIEECDRMIGVCHKHGVILQINHQRHFTLPRITFSRNIIDTGTHVFDKLRQLFGEGTHLRDNLWMFGRQMVEVNYIKSDEYLLEFDCLHTREPMIPLGVQHLVECLNEGEQSISSGEDGREALRLALKFKEIYETSYS